MRSVWCFLAFVRKHQIYISIVFRWP